MYRGGQLFARVAGGYTVTALTVLLGALLHVYTILLYIYAASHRTADAASEAMDKARRVPRIARNQHAAAASRARKKEQLYLVQPGNTRD